MTDAERNEWLRVAPAEQVRLEGVQTPLFLAPKVFKSGSVGWYCSQKAVLGDSPCQVNLCITVIGTKRATTNDSAGEPTPVAGESEEAPGDPQSSPNAKATPLAKKERPRASKGT